MCSGNLITEGVLARTASHLGAQTYTIHKQFRSTYDLSHRFLCMGDGIFHTMHLAGEVGLEPTMVFTLDLESSAVAAVPFPYIIFNGG